MDHPILASRPQAVPVPRSGCPVVPPGAWHIRPDDSSVSFRGRASRLAPTVRAAFSGVTGELLVDPDPNRSTVSVEIELATLSTGNPVYDDILRAADPFCLAKHPQARFESVEVRWQGGSIIVNGLLELAGTASALRLEGHYRHGSAAGVAALDAHGRISTSILGRLDFPGSGLLVPKAMDLSVQIVAASA